MNPWRNLARLLSPLVCTLVVPAAASAGSVSGTALGNDCVRAANVASARMTGVRSRQDTSDTCSAATPRSAGFFELLSAELLPIDTVSTIGDAMARGGKGGEVVRWISNSNGNWHVAANWIDGVVPVDGDSVGFGVGESDLQFETVDTDNAGNGVALPNSLLRLERKMIFSDASAGGDPLLADDGMTFDAIQANGAGGSPVVFNVPVTALTLSSNRHGAVFNREITAVAILARSQHQDRWQINASATSPISLVTIDEQRGPDGDSIDGSFSINSDLAIGLLEQVWGRLIVGAEAAVDVEGYLYHQYVNQAENNNINPITLDGSLTVQQFTVFDIGLASSFELAAGTYGRIGNPDADFQVDFIAGDGLLTVIGVPEIFQDGFEQTATKDDRVPENRRKVLF